jgi:DNA-directed RNA polymerase II subunit RPB1
MATLTGIRLRYYTDEEIKILAVVKVLHASTYDRGVPKTDGINDARMGLIDHTVRCPTCFKANCDQHFGYIELARPVYRLGSINTVLMVLRSVCRECARPKFETLVQQMVLMASLTFLRPSRIRTQVCDSSENYFRGLQKQAHMSVVQGSSTSVYPESKDLH